VLQLLGWSPVSWWLVHPEVVIAFSILRLMIGHLIRSRRHHVGLLLRVKLVGVLREAGHFTWRHHRGRLLDD